MTYLIKKKKRYCKRMKMKIKKSSNINLNLINYFDTSLKLFNLF